MPSTFLVMASRCVSSRQVDLAHVMSELIRVKQKLSACAGSAAQLDAIGVMNDAIEDRIGHQLPTAHAASVDGKLAGDDQRAGIVAIFDDLQQIALLLLRQQRFRIPNRRE